MEEEIKLRWGERRRRTETILRIMVSLACLNLFFFSDAYFICFLQDATNSFINETNQSLIQWFHSVDSRVKNVTNG